MKYEFKKLSVDKAKKIYPKADSEMTLADAYFAENEKCENVYNYYDLDFEVKQTIHKITNNGGKQ